eukprot:6294278-Pyramimonas_sp.AAC.1
MQRRGLEAGGWRDPGPASGRSIHMDCVLPGLHGEPRRRRRPGAARREAGHGGQAAHGPPAWLGTENQRSTWPAHDLYLDIRPLIQRPPGGGKTPEGQHAGHLGRPDHGAHEDRR